MAPDSGAAAVADPKSNDNAAYSVPAPFGAPPVPVPTFPDLVREAEASKQEAKAAAVADEPTTGDNAGEPELTGDALAERARELDIKGRSQMDADELRAAIAAAEAGE